MRSLGDLGGREGEFSDVVHPQGIIHVELVGQRNDTLELSPICPCGGLGPAKSYSSHLD